MSARRRPLLKRLLSPAIRRAGHFARDERGVTLIEFGILAVPFFTIIFAILETALLFLGTQVLDSSVEDASRMIRTGRAQASGFSLAQFRSYMCDYTFNLFDCSKIMLKVKVIDNFSAAQVNEPVQECDKFKCEWKIVETFTPGAGRNVVQVTAYYRWPLIVVLPYFNLKNQPDNYRLISATRVFRNEPFS